MAAKGEHGEVELGFLEKCDDPAELTAASFPSKVGGKPIWLDPVCLPPTERVLCKQCQKPCVLLLQIYAPLTDDPASYHRTLYVFVCRDPVCHKKDNSKSFRVLRCSLPKQNSYYCNSDDDDDDGEASSVDHKLSTPSVCQVCGCLAPKQCGKCSRAHYCSREHQRWDWTVGHRLLCNDIAKGRNSEDLGYQPGSGLLLPLFEIVTESEPEETENKERSEADRLADYHKFISSSKYSGDLLPAGSDKILEEAMGNGIGETDCFRRFKRRIKREPEQVLRYGRDGTPLLINDSSHTPPNCTYCGEKRTFEFQVMPQLLYYLKLDSLTEDSIDWGTLLVYTCSSDCQPCSPDDDESPSTNPYREEFLLKQDI